jgi:hypothetical protein
MPRDHVDRDAKGTNGSDTHDKRKAQHAREDERRRDAIDVAIDKAHAARAGARRAREERTGSSPEQPT